MSKQPASRYADIINLERPVSHHPKMSRSDRAAQFSPFAALTNYHEKVAEVEKSQRYTGQEIIEIPDI